jgi:hypothetical protein
VPCFPKDILSDVRQSEIKKSTDDPRRMLEKMYAEAFSNFRKLIEGNVSQKRGREILAFFSGEPDKCDTGIIYKSIGEYAL